MMHVHFIHRTSIGTSLRYVRVSAIANPSVVCNVCAPYSRGVETFGNISSSFYTSAIV